MIIKNKILSLPLRWLLGFLIFTEILFFIGPIEYGIKNKLLLIAYLLILNVSLYIGYKKGETFHKVKLRGSITTIKIIIFLALPLELIKMMSMWGLIEGISISTIFEKVYVGVVSPGDAYANNFGKTTYLSYLAMIMSPITFSAIPLGVYYWNKLHFSSRFFLILIIFLEIFIWLGMGTRKGLLDIIIIIAFTLILKKPEIILEGKSRLRLRMGLIIVISTFLFYFTYSIISRFGEESLSSIKFLTQDNLKASYYMNYSPYFIIPLSYLTSYLCQGYEALSHALDIGILPLNPMGISWFTIQVAENFGYDVSQNTYMYIIESNTGFGMSMNWHTAYVWLANGLSFIGVPFFIFYIGFLLARTWQDGISGKDIFAIPLNSLLILMVFYLFANNQILSFSFIPFLFFFSMYIINFKFKL